MNVRTIVVVVVLILLGVLALDSFFVVDARQRAIQKRFGEVVEHKQELTGLNFKIPLVDEIQFFDGRILYLDTPADRYLSIEQKPLIVDSFVKWRVFDTKKYYEATQGIEENAQSRLTARVDEGLRNQIGSRTMLDVVSGDARDELMSELTNNLDNILQEELGVRVIDVRVKQIDLPPEVASQVYERMRSERKIEADRFRAQGREQKLTIEADADKQRVVIRAEAERLSEQTRGEGDREATRIYAEAYSQDPEFYEFYRSINAYVNVFKEGNSVLVLDPSSEFFKYLKSGTGE